MASLGLQKIVSELQASMKNPVRKWHRAVHGCTPLRRSNRLNGMLRHAVYGCTCLRRSSRLKGITVDPTSERNSLWLSDQLKEKPGKQLSSLEGLGNGEGEEKLPASAPFLSVDASELRFSPDVLARGCDGKGKGSDYDPVFGICCHYCSEEDCKRCSDLECSYETLNPVFFHNWNGTKAREEGYKSVAQLLMDKLQRAAKLRR